MLTFSIGIVLGVFIGFAILLAVGAFIRWKAADNQRTEDNRKLWGECLGLRRRAEDAERRIEEMLRADKATTYKAAHDQNKALAAIAEHFADAQNTPPDEAATVTVE